MSATRVCAGRVVATMVIGCATFNVPAKTRTPDRLRDQARFAGQRRFVDLCRAVHDVAVDCDARTGRHHDAVAGADRVERNRLDVAVRFARRCSGSSASQ